MRISRQTYHRQVYHMTCAFRVELRKQPIDGYAAAEPSVARKQLMLGLELFHLYCSLNEVSSNNFLIFLWRRQIPTETPLADVNSNSRNSVPKTGFKGLMAV